MTSCARAPWGWYCTRPDEHEGACAAVPVRRLPAPEATVDPDPDVPAALMALAGGHGRLLWHKSRPWASANHAGSRDEVALEFFGGDASDAGEAMLFTMHEAEFVLFGRIVADIVLGYHTRLYRPQKRTIAVIELLLIED